MKARQRRAGFIVAVHLVFLLAAGTEPPRLALTPQLLAPHPATERNHALYKSSDEGWSWTFAGHGISADNRINALLVLDRGALAGTDQGIFSSPDAERWNSVRTGVPDGTRVRELLSDGDRIYAATAKHGVLRSSDSGTTWSAANEGLPDASILSLAHHRSRTFTGTDSQGVFVSENGGATWHRLGEGLPAHSQVFDLQMVGEELFAGLYSKGVFKLPAGGERWEKTGDVVPLQLTATPTTLFAGHNPGGVWTSRDQGKSWREASLGLPGNAPIWVLASRDDTVFVGTAGVSGLFVSRNEGAMWMKSDVGLPEHSSPVAFAAGKDYVLTGIVLNPPE